MRQRLHVTRLAVGMALLALGRPALAGAATSDTVATDTATTLPQVEVKARRQPDRLRLAGAALDAARARTSDSAQLLATLPGVDVHGAGGVSGLPVLHGMADDRLLVRVDGVTVPASCPNHMNSPLSYIDASRVAAVKVYDGTAPVSAGGDNIGGVVVLDPASPLFAGPGKVLTRGLFGGYYRSNGNAAGAHVSATVADDQVSLTYTGSIARANDYRAAQDFKPAGASAGRGWLAGDRVGSSAYRSENHQLALAWRGARDLAEVKIDLQHAPYEGFPNQRMDMTGNNAYQLSTRYRHRYDWGNLDARFYDQYVRHSMQFGDDKQFVYGSYAGMPMETASHTTGATLTAELPVLARDTLKLGGEVQHYRLDDWWPAAGATGGMGPNTFWNLDNGQRNRLDAFGELDHVWADGWTSNLGLRLASVRSDAGNVQGYNTTATYATDAAAFNAGNRRRTDLNLDLSASLRFAPSAARSYELAFARKSRSPGLYERYTWSSMGMAAVMNNTAGDGNGYFGNPDLKPEVANTVSLHGHWADPSGERWSVDAAPYYSYVQNYIDAARCGTTLCGGSSNLTATTGYVTLQYVNQNAELYGADLNGKLALARQAWFGQLDLTGKLSYTRGRNLATGDNLYNIMPLNARLALEQRQGIWRNTLELQLVSAKHNLSQVRNEVRTPGFALLNLRSHYQWHRLGVELGIDNVFNRFYVDPLGGAYTGQGRTMSKNGIPWGVGVPGPARTFYTSFEYRFD